LQKAHKKQNFGGHVKSFISLSLLRWLIALKKWVLPMAEGHDANAGLAQRARRFSGKTTAFRQALGATLKTTLFCNCTCASTGLCCALLAAANGYAAPIPPGNSQQLMSLPGAQLPVFTYRPVSCNPTLILFVFHGIGRDAGPYRDHARPIADRLCAIIVAPEFDRAHFPRNAYQYGGIVHHGKSVAIGSRTIDLVPPLVLWARQAAGQAQLPYALLGHSAGAQFIDRVAAYSQPGASRFVIADPSTWVMPSLTTPQPFGFAGEMPEAAEQALKAYLASPITVLLGEDDTRAKWLAKSREARAQGANRYVRGLNAFHLAQATAERRGWPFHWRLIEVPGIGHNATKMFASPQAIEAFMVR
jgi:hypothetical protein